MSDNAAPNIMIVGGNFIGKGAEAMMFTVREAVEAAIPQAVFWVQPVYEAERPRFEEHGFRTVKRRRTPVRDAVDLALGLCGLSRRRPATPQQIGPEGISNAYRVSDAVIDVSGFRSSDQIGPKRAVGRLARYAWARRAGNKFLFMPQSWGPFENRWVRWSTRLMLRNAELVCAREDLSAEYLTKSRCIAPERIVLAPDIAFQFKAAAPERGREVLAKAGLTNFRDPLVALTPNMRVFERTKGQGNENPYLTGLVRITEHFLRNTAASILLIPHEDSAFAANDPELCEMIAERANDPARVIQLSAKESAADIKAVIGLTDLHVASRYHGLIAALSMRVPSAVIGWSHKYDEVMREVGQADLVTDPVRRSADGILEVVVQAWTQRTALRGALEERVPQLEKRSQLAIERMIEIIQPAGSGP